VATILILEEDNLIHGLLEEWLVSAGYRVQSASLQQALSTGSRGESIDLILVDIYMPRHVGAEMVCAVQRAHPGTPVIAISGQFRPGLPGSSTAARALGARQVIAKPFTRNDLLAAVRAVIAPAG
jgi:CheY-like chemotaxis protein